jgi:hypothetical protein
MFNEMRVAHYLESTGHRVSPVPTFKLREGEEERKYLAPRPGCGVLSPFSCHSRAILLFAVPN